MNEILLKIYENFMSNFWRISKFFNVLKFILKKLKSIYNNIEIKNLKEFFKTITKIYLIFKKFQN